MSEQTMRSFVFRQATPEVGAMGGQILVIEPHKGLFALDLKGIWEYRELLYFLVWRDLKVRYRQTVIGAGWVILQPLLTMIIFTIVFGKVAKLPSDGIPYPIFNFTALLPWNLFSGSLNRGGTSIVSNSSLVSKIYFPRVLLPLSATLSPLVDFAVAFVILIAMMIWYGIAPTWGIVALPLFIFLVILTALAVALWLSALDVRYRDVGHAIPFLLQIWMFASPVAYSVSIIPVKWRLLYGLNPMAGVIEGFRWALLGNQSPDFRVITVSAAVMLVLLFFGIVYYQHTERTCIDVI